MKSIIAKKTPPPSAQEASLVKSHFTRRHFFLFRTHIFIIPTVAFALKDDFAGEKNNNSLCSFPPQASSLVLGENKTLPWFPRLFLPDAQKGREIDAWETTSLSRSSLEEPSRTSRPLWDLLVAAYHSSRAERVEHSAFQQNERIAGLSKTPRTQ